MDGRRTGLVHATVEVRTFSSGLICCFLFGFPQRPHFLRFRLAKQNRATGATKPAKPATDPLPPIPLRADSPQFELQVSNGPSLPSPAMAWGISTIIVVHFFLVGLSYFSTVASSSTQNLMLGTVRPYLGITHFDADGVTFCFATSDRSEKNHLLQQSSKSRGETEDDWTMVESPGMVGGDRQRRWQRFLAAVAELGNNEQTALAAWLVEPLAIAQSEAQSIRITREPDLMTTVVDDAAAPPYAAAIVRQDDGSARLVQVPPPRLAAEPIGNALLEKTPVDSAPVESAPVDKAPVDRPTGENRE